jgi:deoxyribonuclease IV
VLLGAHMSIAGGMPRAVSRAAEADCRVLQVFVKNASRWEGRILSDAECIEFRDAVREAGLTAAVAHDSYLINLASPEEDLWRRSIDALADEMERCERLGLGYLVAHPGAHLGAGETSGIRRIAAAIDRVLERAKGATVRIALETTAGQGSSIGYRFEHLRDLLAAAARPERLAICLDTCHVFAAGYDIRDRDSYERTFEEFHRVVGLDRLAALHLNDSRRPLGSRVDRHAHIGEGEIGLEGFSLLVNDPRLEGLPKILETPKEEDGDRRNLARLRSLVRSASGEGPERVLAPTAAGGRALLEAKS